MKEAGTEPRLSGEKDVVPVPEFCAVSFSHQNFLANSAKREFAEQENAEALTKTIAPEAYRLSDLPEDVLTRDYRQDGDVMTDADLLRYLEECRAAGRAVRGESNLPGVYESAELTEEEKQAPAEVEPVEEKAPAEMTVRQMIRLLPVAVVNRCKKGIPTWFDSSKPDPSANRRKFPLSAFAALITVAVSMMLIVASSLMITSAESKIGKVNREIKVLNNEIADLRSDLESNENMLRIREVAVNEYGMIGEEFLKKDYLSLNASDKIEVFDDDRSDGIGLSSLLSAMGFGK